MAIRVYGVLSWMFACVAVIWWRLASFRGNGVERTVVAMVITLLLFSMMFAGQAIFAAWRRQRPDRTRLLGRFEVGRRNEVADAIDRELSDVPWGHGLPLFSVAGWWSLAVGGAFAALRKRSGFTLLSASFEAARVGKVLSLH